MLPSLDVVEAVGRHNDDIGLADVPANGRGVDFDTLADLSFVCALPADHELARKRVVKPKDLKDTPLLMVSPASYHHQRIMETFQAAMIRPSVTFESSNSGPLRALVARGEGIAILDPITAAFGDADKIQIRRFSPEISYNLRIIYAAKRPIAKHVKAFAEVAHIGIETLQRRIP